MKSAIALLTIGHLIQLVCCHR